MRAELANISPEQPVLIAGPTASGKSELAMELASRQGGIIINADALQVFENWRVLTARPSAADEAALPHHLYGHVARDHEYSVGQWLREVGRLLNGSARPIIVGGTGLYFSVLTEGLADIPATPPNIRTEGNLLLADQGIEALLANIDAETRERIDIQNPMRVQRAWAVQRTTGRGLASWQDATPPPILPIAGAHTILLNADRDWLNARIVSRFENMLNHGALDEARANRPGWSNALPAAKAIGARELMAHLDGDMSLEAVSDSVSIATRQFAKRQRSWFRARMSQWNFLSLP